MLTETQEARFDEAARNATRPGQLRALDVYRRRTARYMATDLNHTALLARRAADCDEALRGLERVGVYDDILA